MLKVGTIREIHRQLVENGYHIAETAIRRWVKSGELPACYSGKTAYVSYDKAVALLTAEATYS